MALAYSADVQRLKEDKPGEIFWLGLRTVISLSRCGTPEVNARLAGTLTFSVISSATLAVPFFISSVTVSGASNLEQLSLAIVTSETGTSSERALSRGIFNGRFILRSDGRVSLGQAPLQMGLLLWTFDRWCPLLFSRGR